MVGPGVVGGVRWAHAWVVHHVVLQLVESTDWWGGSRVFADVDESLPTQKPVIEPPKEIALERRERLKRLATPIQSSASH